MVPPAGGPVYVPAEATIVNAQTVENDPDIQHIAAQPLGSSTRVRLLTYVRFEYHGPGSGLTDEFPIPGRRLQRLLDSFHRRPELAEPKLRRERVHPAHAGDGSLPVRARDPRRLQVLSERTGLRRHVARRC
jgi:hypothetical protein